MRRASGRRADAVASVRLVTRREIRSRLIQQLRRASSMELAAVTALDPLVEGHSDGSLSRLVSTHRANSRRHRERVLARLKALGAGAPGGASAGAGILAAARGIARGRRGATEEERLRQAVLMKQLEVATYDTVERLAERAGDEDTARIAREARADDEELARRLARRRLRLQRRRG
jgi:ferritin-like metal-binding protein YciE